MEKEKSDKSTEDSAERTHDGEETVKNDVDATMNEEDASGSREGRELERRKSPGDAVFIPSEWSPQPAMRTETARNEACTSPEHDIPHFLSQRPARSGSHPAQ